MSAAAARTAIFAACAAAHAALIAAFWSTVPLRAPDRSLPALVYALPAPGTVTVVADALPETPSPRPAPAYARGPAAPVVRGDTASPEAPFSRGLALGDAAFASVPPVSVAASRAASPERETAERVTPIATSATGDIEPSTVVAPTPLPPAARALPPAPQRADLQLAYHRMRAAQDALRFHHAQGEHLAWLQHRVTALLAAAAEPDAMPEGARCTAHIVDTHLSVQCDDPALGERLARADGDLAVFLSRLITLTAPGGTVEIGFLPAQPPVVAGL